MGIQVNPGHGKGSGPSKGTYLRLYSDFYISDIILASPIALKLVMESNPNKLDCDFLSSIEQVIVHQADVLSMQNWEHVDFVLRHLNQLPKDQHEETDFSRVRSYFLDGLGARYRQLMMLSAFNSPELQACFREFACCHRGQMRLKKDWEVLSPLALRTSQMTPTTQDTVMTLTESRGGGDGTINDVYVSAKQVFLHIPLPTSGENELRGTNMVEEAEERRFLYFKDQVLAPILRLKQARTMIVTPSYLDFVRVRNYLIEQEVLNKTFWNCYVKLVIIFLFYCSYSAMQHTYLSIPVKAILLELVPIFSRESEIFCCIRAVLISFDDSKFVALVTWCSIHCPSILISIQKWSICLLLTMMTVLA